MNFLVNPHRFGAFMPSIVPATFDGTANLVALSNGNRTVTHNNTTTNAGAISTSTKTTGKRYFESAIQVSVSSSTFVGIMSTNFAGIFGTTICATDTTSIQAINSTIYSNGGNTGTVLGTTTIGDVFSFAIDLTARLAWIRRNGGNWNNNVSANPATGVGGVAIAPTLGFSPFVRFAASGVSTDRVAANFGQAAFVFPVPAGFTNGWEA